MRQRPSVVVKIVTKTPTAKAPATVKKAAKPKKMVMPDLSESEPKEYVLKKYISGKVVEKFRRDLSHDLSNVFVCLDGNNGIVFESDGRYWNIESEETTSKGLVEDVIKAKSTIIYDCRYKVDGYVKQLLFVYYPATNEFVIDRPRWFE